MQKATKTKSIFYLLLKMYLQKKSTKQMSVFQAMYVYGKYSRKRSKCKMKEIAGCREITD